MFLLKSNYNYGGQAVIEGVMMRGPSAVSVAVRDPGGDIQLDYRLAPNIFKRYPWLNLPLVRGAFALYDSLMLGLQALAFSASIASDEEEAQLSKAAIMGTIALGFLLGIGFFVILPNLLAGFLISVKHNVLFNLVEGIVRIALFIGYIFFIARHKDIQRVFQYHGAEHKVINTLEAGEELSVKAVRPFSTIPPRCGTSFILLVLLLSIIVFSLIGEQGWFWRLASRVLLLPFIAGISYEIIKLAGRHKEKIWLSWIVVPGLWLQHITTGEPDDQQIEVAIAALSPLLADEVGKEQAVTERETFA